MTDNKAIVRRLVGEVMNGNEVEVLDELCSAELSPKLRVAFEQFRTAFPDWHQETVDHRIAGMWGLEDTWTRMRQLTGDAITLGELGTLG